MGEVVMENVELKPYEIEKEFKYIQSLEEVKNLKGGENITIETENMIFIICSD